MKRAIVIAFALIILAGWGSSSVFDVKLDRQDAVPDGTSFVITWESRVEVDLDRYVLEKRTVFSPGYTTMTTVEPKGAGYEYSYRDTEVYKGAEEVIEYRIKALSPTAQEIVFEPLQVTYTPTAVRRTWGSIKAMFQ